MKPRTHDAFGCLPMAALFIVAVAAVVWFTPSVFAHESYTGRNDPVTTLGCCGGSDCAPVPLTADWVQPVKEGYRVTLTVEQAQHFNKYASRPIDVVVPYSRVMVIGTVLKPYTGPPALYHICIVTNQLRCLFATPGT